MGKKKRHDLTADEIMAWAEGFHNKGRASTATRLGVSETTVKRWRAKVNAIMRERFDLNEFRMPLYDLYPLWLNSVIQNLKECDTSMTVAFAKGMQLFQERSALDANLAGMSDAELAGLITSSVPDSPADEGDDGAGGSGASEAEDSGEEPIL